MKIKHQQFGFTLIEALVTVVIIGVIGLILSDLISRSFRGNDQSVAISNLKQNGQAALNSIDASIRNADAIACPIPSGTSTTSVVLVLNNKDGTYTRIWFSAGSSTGNGSIMQDNPVPTNPNLTADLCNFNLTAPINRVWLTATDTSTGVSVSNGQFEIFNPAGSKAHVGVSFLVNPAVYSPITTTPIEFRTTVQLR